MLRHPPRKGVTQAEINRAGGYDAWEQQQREAREAYDEAHPEERERLVELMDDLLEAREQKPPPLYHKDETVNRLVVAVEELERRVDALVAVLVEEVAALRKESLTND